VVVIETKERESRRFLDVGVDLALGAIDEQDARDEGVQNPDQLATNGLAYPMTGIECLGVQTVVRDVFVG
jgi:hypothetical protein